MTTQFKKLCNGYSITALLFCAILLFNFINLCSNAGTIREEVQLSLTSSTDTYDLEAPDNNVRLHSYLLKAVFNGLDSAVNKNVYERMSLINLNGWMQRTLNKQFIPEPSVNNNVYKMTNGQLTYTYPEFGVDIAHKNFSVLKKYLDSVGTNFVYIQAPYKVDKNNNTMPYGLVDYPNLNADKLMVGLRKLGVDAIDFREVFAECGTNYEDLFYNTDHHWKTETAFFAYQYLLTHLKKTYQFSYDNLHYDLANYTQTTLPASFVGSLANRVGNWYAGVDDFTFLYPSFATSLTYTKIDESGAIVSVRSGTFEESVFYKDRMENPDTPLPYRDNCYFNGNPALGTIINENVPEGKALFVQDSFGKPLASFMALNFHEVDVIDLRDYTKQFLIDYIKQDHYDYVFVLYNPSALKRSTYYKQFHFYDYQ